MLINYQSEDVGEQRDRNLQFRGEQLGVKFRDFQVVEGTHVLRTR